MIPAAIDKLRQWLQSIADRNKYRPERHYMRGPGPKTRLTTAPEHGHAAAGAEQHSP